MHCVYTRIALGQMTQHVYNIYTEVLAVVTVNYSVVIYIIIHSIQSLHVHSMTIFLFKILSMR